MSDDENIIIDNDQETIEDNEDKKEREIMNMINEIKIYLKNAKLKKDYDDIIKKYKIKIIKNGKIVSPMKEKIIIKKNIINFKINEPEDVFDLDCFIQGEEKKNKK